MSPGKEHRRLLVSSISPSDTRGFFGLGQKPDMKSTSNSSPDVVRGFVMGDLR